jgi:hypothetical protein
MILAFACSDDKEDEPVFSGGNFKGTYTVIRDFNGDANTEVDTMTFQFLETGSVDTLLIDNDSTMSGATNFCDCVCTWQLVGDSLRILLVSQSDADDICDPLENPAQTYNHFVDGNKFVFVKFDMNTYPPDNTDIYRKIELWIN